MSKRLMAVSGKGLAVGAAVLGLMIASLAPILTRQSRAADAATTSTNIPATPESSKTDSGKADPATSASTKPAARNVLIPPQVDIINDEMRKSWADHRLTPSGLATDGEWCRRIYLDVIGRIPTLDELNRFLGDHSANRRINLVDRLLGEEYVIEYARNWSGIWTNLLIGRPGRKQDDEKLPTNREGMEKYLREAFGRNKHYNKMVYELVSATGSTVPDEDGFNGAVNFLVGKMDENGVQATAKTAQYFLGLSVQCTQCHNHPFNEWKQNQFWELNAFFRQTQMKKTMAARRKVEHAVLSNVDFRGESASKGGGGDMSSAELYYELRNGIMKVAYPVFVDGTEVSRSGALKDIDRRSELAKMIVKSEYLGKAIVNRMWGHFFGYAFTKPIDDMGPHNPPSHPELLEKLAAEFSKHRYEDDGYDLKQLIRWIVLSEPYALSSHFNKTNRGDDPALGEKPQFSHFYIRQMSAEQLYESMLTATGAEYAAKGTPEKRQEEKEKWLSQFVIAFGTDDGGQASTFNGSIPQTLMMFNGEMMQMATRGEKGTFLEAVTSNSRISPVDKVSYLYLAGLARKPSKAELEGLHSSITSANTMAAFQDVWWAILNSNEFIMNH